MHNLLLETGTEKRNYRKLFICYYLGGEEEQFGWGFV